MARPKSRPIPKYQSYVSQNIDEKSFQLIEVLPDAAVITQNDGTILLINKKTELLLGYKREELVGQSVEILMPERFRNKHVKEREEYTTKPSLRSMGFGLERYALHKNGAEIPVDISLSPFETDEGLLIISSIRDITERKKIEEEKETLMHNMGERVKELQCLYGLADSISKHKTVKEIFMDILALIPPGWHYPEITRGKIRFDEQDYVTDPFEETEWRQTSDILIDGKRRGSVEVYYLEECPELDEGPFLSEERNLIDGIASSLSEAIKSKKIEEAIKESEERYRALSEAAFEAIFITEKGVCLEQNSTAEKMFGYILSEAIGRKGTEWIAAEDREMVVNNMLSGYEEPYEAVALRKDGSTFPAEIQGKMTHYKGRTVRVTALRDITERKQMEEELMNSREEMKNKNIALHEILSQVEIEKQKIKDDVVSNVDTFLLPLLKKIKITDENSKYLGIIQNSLNNLTSTFGSRISEKSARLTSREIEICNMIRNGLTNKEISNLLFISIQTVNKHRSRIRKKLGITNTNYNLPSFLKTL